MNEKVLDRIRVASPCSVSWESMSGTERARFCRECKLHVYDFSELTRKEAIELVINTQGRVCGRLHRRADGTMITRDCPVGLRALRRRATRVAGATLAAVFSLFAAVGAQKRPNSDECKTVHEFTIRRKSVPGHAATIKGKVVDLNLAVVPNAKIKLVNKKTKQSLVVDSSPSGEFLLPNLQSGNYDLSAESPGLKSARLKSVRVNAEDEINLEVT